MLTTPGGTASSAVPATRSLGPVFTRADARDQGMTDDAIRYRLGTGRWVRLRRGVHTTAELWTAATPAQRHLLAVSAALRATRHPVVVSHRSAALLLGLPLAAGIPARPSLTVPRHLRGFLDDVDLHLMASGATPPSTTLARAAGGPVVVTSPARTLVDLATTAARVDAVVAAEHAFRVGACTPYEVRAEARGRSAPVRSAAAQLLEIADARSPDDFTAAVRAALGHRVRPPDSIGLPVVLPGPSTTYVAATWVRQGVAVVPPDPRLAAVVRALGLRPVTVDADEAALRPDVTLQRVARALAASAPTGAA
jgi:hypothetical protein